MIIAHGRLLEHDTIDALKNRHRRIIELTPAADPERFLAVLALAGHKAEWLSNGRLRLESASDSIAWVLELMRDHQLPPAEVVANPNALHELFVQVLAANHGHES
ncbi:MAG: hypothetical protein EXS38_08135 [Opitutus sp.]|nr:hypothetical protein [Opitutus sp.]